MYSNNQVRDGVKAAIPIILAAAPFGMLFGALAVDNGMTVFEAVLMSATVYAGASQMVGIDLFGDRVAAWLIVLSIFAVNFRHVLYSAVLGRNTRSWTRAQRFFGFFFLIDPQFAESEKRSEAGKQLSFLWYMSAAIPIYVTWVIEAWIGAVFGKLVSDPAAYGIDFLLPVYFLGLVMGFRRRANWLLVVAVSSVASIVAFSFIGSPWHVSVGALAGVAAAGAIGVKPRHTISE